MPQHHAAFIQPFGACRDHVLLVNLIQEGVFCEHGQGCKTAYGHRGNRQCQVPEIVSNFCRPAQLGPVLRRQAPEREPVQVTAPGKHQ